MENIAGGQGLPHSNIFRTNPLNFLKFKLPLKLTLQCQDPQYWPFCYFLHAFLISGTFFISQPFQICPEMRANEMQALDNNHHKVSSHIKVHQNTHDSVRHEVI